MKKNENDKKFTILVVDDDRRVLKSLKLWFSNEGFETLTATGGHEAMELMMEHPVDVAVLDFRIGKEDGLSIARSLKEADETIKVIILTGFPSYETAVEAMKIGVFDYLSKGAANEKIIGTIKRALEARQEEGLRLARDVPEDPRTKMILFCNHSLIKERLENFLNDSKEFNLAMSFPSLDSFRVKNLPRDIQVALVCAGCNIKVFKDAYTVFPDLYQALPGIKTMVINETFTDREKVELLKLGIRGFLSPDSSCETLGQALTRVAAGDPWVSRSVSYLSLKDIVRYDPLPQVKRPNTFGLTNRESQILKEITHGLKNRQIAQQLDISEKTVKTHVNRILKKLGVDNRTKAVLTALERKII